MVDSCALLLTIVMSTPVEPLDAHSGQDTVSINTLDGIMQRLCWPHSTTLNMDCEAGAEGVVAQQDEQSQNLIKALTTFRYNHHRR